MKANEFRIGNFIQRKDKVFQCKLDDLMVIRDFEDHGYSYVELNEEWFLKLWFQLEHEKCEVEDFEDENLFWWDFYNFHVDVNVCGNGVDYIYVDQYAVPVYLKYVHELQNLYFAIRKNELSTEKPKYERPF
jgi:hypothetical protein